jgi:hypothetical protein
MWYKAWGSHLEFSLEIFTILNSFAIHVFQELQICVKWDCVLIYIFLAADKLLETRSEPCFWLMLVGAVHPLQAPCFSLFSYPIAWLEGLGVWFILYPALLGADIDCFPSRCQCASVRVWWVRAPQLCGGWTSFLRKADDVAVPCVPYMEIQIQRAWQCGCCHHCGTGTGSVPVCEYLEHQWG